MEDDGGVLTGFDDLVQIADGALPDRTSERTVDPDGFSAAQEESANEIGGRQVVVTGHGNQRATEVMCHGLNETRFAAPRRAFQHDRKALLKGSPEHLHLGPDRHVERRYILTHVPLLSIDRSSVDRVTRSDRLRCTSAVPRAARNKGPIALAMRSVLPNAAYAAVPNTLRNASASVVEAILRQRHPMP